MTTPMPEFMKALVSELRLDDTPSSDLEGGVTNMFEVIKNIEFTASGWEHVKRLIRGDSAVTRTSLFQRITDESDDDLLLFTIMIAIPYGLANTLGHRLGYATQSSEKLINYFTAAFVIAMARGYELGAKDSREARQSREE